MASAAGSPPSLRDIAAARRLLVRVWAFHVFESGLIWGHIVKSERRSSVYETLGGYSDSNI